MIEEEISPRLLYDVFETEFGFVEFRFAAICTSSIGFFPDANRPLLANGNPSICIHTSAAV